MRLSTEEKNTIISCILEFDPHAKVYLFGSRTDEHKKGGDLDILVISELLSFSDKFKILAKIEGAMGEQQIDLLLKNQDEADKSSFVQSFISDAILLNP
ncbi:MAG: nucleotidyltransferase domain-containing protein [Oligoflexia bacterium]|nr:nucleotidyltransferase domain-containing protein [Oligoflexia bacterium]